MIRIEAHALGKQYPHRGPRVPFRWRDWLHQLRHRENKPPFWALRDVSFEVKAGETLGVIGRNGAGKSTLLWLLSGISQPTTGRVAIHGRIGALLELGGAFADDLTGRENALLAGVSAGLTRREVRNRLDEIVAFAEIAEFIDDPVRTYSTGMRMRLAFSVAVHTEPDVLLVDEFLAVGDLAFQAKCRARIARMRAEGCAVVLVSHGLGDVRESCDRVLWLRDGCIVALDTPEVVTSLYEAEMHQRTLELTPEPTATGNARKTARKRNRVGSRELEITNVLLRSGTTMRSGTPFAIELCYRGRAAARAPIFVVSIVREDGTVCLDTNTEAARISTHGLPPTGVIRFSVPRLELGAGRYFVDVGVFHAKWTHAYDHHSRVYPLTIEGASGLKGILAAPVSWEASTLVAASPNAPSPALSRER